MTGAAPSTTEAVTATESRTYCVPRCSTGQVTQLPGEEEEEDPPLSLPPLLLFAARKEEHSAASLLECWVCCTAGRRFKEGCRICQANSSRRAANGTVGH